MKRTLAVILCALLLSGCASGGARAEKRVIVYFPSWNLYSDADARVENLPFDRITCVNHAFWMIVKDGAGGYAIASADPEADEKHFPGYARMKAEHPGTDILISIGGWTRCGYFSEMAASEEGRASFISSCLSLMEANLWLDGFDIDWEYPGVSRPAAEGDEGNPVVGDDKANLTLLLKEARKAFDLRFGEGVKRLTLCVSGSVSACRMQDAGAYHPYVDSINIMTYDYAGAWSSATAPASPLYGSDSADAAVRYLLKQGVPPDKLCIGTPLYSHGWSGVKADARHLSGLPTSGAISEMTWKNLRVFEREAKGDDTPGWHLAYDDTTKSAYLYNDDPASPYHQVFLTYESARSLDAKLDYIRDNSLGGIIVWQSGGDDARDDWPMITRMHERLSE